MRASYGKGTVVVTCDAPARFEVAIGEADGSSRKLVGPQGRRLRYGLYRDPSYSSAWGDGGSLGPTVKGACDGERPVRLTIYGVIPAQRGADARRLCEPDDGRSPLLSRPDARACAIGTRPPASAD